MRKWAIMSTRTYVPSLATANVVVGGKEIRKFWSAFENIQTIQQYDFQNIFKHLMVFVLNLENFILLLAFFKFERKWKLLKKKCYIAL